MLPSKSPFNRRRAHPNPTSFLDLPICVYCAIRGQAFEARAQRIRKYSRNVTSAKETTAPQSKRSSSPHIKFTSRNPYLEGSTDHGTREFAPSSDRKTCEKPSRSTPSPLGSYDLINQWRIDRFRNASKTARASPDSTTFIRPKRKGYGSRAGELQADDALGGRAKSHPVSDNPEIRCKQAKSLLATREPVLRVRLRESLEDRAPELNRVEVEEYWQDYIKLVGQSLDQSKGRVPTLSQLQDTIEVPLLSTVKFDRLLEKGFLDYALCDRVVEKNYKGLSNLADLRYPLEQFPLSRELKRRFHLHVGPTNSGKTYQALQALRRAKRGVYAAPLRLLAHETYTRLNATGIPCDLVTGDERRQVGIGPAGIKSCTVEMTNCKHGVEVAVIDEIQMLADPERGSAWTQAVLGVRAREVHLCGEARAVPIIQALCAYMGSELTIHEYQRLSPLEVAPTSLGRDLSQLEKGDCFVTFSRTSIQLYKRQIERITGKRCAVIYGALPSESRAEQARLFNDPYNDYDFMVASDAIGMGLNLSIKRVIFEALYKFNGKENELLPRAQIKQIAGRAGRYRVARDDTTMTGPVDGLPTAPLSMGEKGSDTKEDRNIGVVTTFDPVEHPYLQQVMSEELEPIKRACYEPPPEALLNYGMYFAPGTPWASVRERFEEQARMHPLFTLRNSSATNKHSNYLLNVHGLNMEDTMTIAKAPVAKQHAESLVGKFGIAIANRKPTSVLDMAGLQLELLDDSDLKVQGMQPKARLPALEELHSALSAFLWLSFRFPSIFIERELALHVKQQTGSKIDEVLHSLHDSDLKEAQERGARVSKEMMDTIMSEHGEADDEPDVDSWRLDPVEHPVSRGVHKRPIYLKPPPDAILQVFHSAKKEPTQGSTARESMFDGSDLRRQPEGSLSHLYKDSEPSALGAVAAAG